MVVSVKSWTSEEVIGTCGICDGDLLANELVSGLTKADGTFGKAHSKCLPDCKGEFSSGHSSDNLQTGKCARCSWLETAKPGDVWY